MERSTESKKEKSLEGTIIAGAHRPPSATAPEATEELHNQPNPTPTIHPQSLAGTTIITNIL